MSLSAVGFRTSNKGMAGTGNAVLFESAIFILFTCVFFSTASLFSIGAECRLCGIVAFH